MDFEKGIGRSAIAIPFVHVLTCSLYIAGYSATFGNGIGGLFGPSDFFTITLQHLMVTYAVGFALPGLIILARHRLGYAYLADKIAAETNQQEKDNLIRYRDWQLFTLKWTATVNLVLIFTGLVLEIYVNTYRAYYFASIAMLLPLTPLWWKVANRLRFYGPPAELTWAAICFAVGIFCFGMESGQIDLNASYSEVAGDGMHCRHFVVLGPVGEHFIAVAPNNGKVVIDKECAVRFVIPPRAPLAHGSLYELVSRKWAGGTTAPPPAVPKHN